jgi:uncharacterized lipoprotein YddW (UPF0748 family)
MLASVNLPRKTMTLGEACAELGKQTSSEFYVDRRHGETKIAVHTYEARLATVMRLIELASGHQWRMVGDMFFLSEEAEGSAVKKWQEKYAEARKAHLAGAAENRVREWVNFAMPFPPKVDPVWQLTPLQREQIAFQQSLLLPTMTPPQLDWLNTMLPARGYRAPEGRDPVDQLAADLPSSNPGPLGGLPEIPLKFNAALVIGSLAGDFLVEMPLGQLAAGGTKAPSPAKPARVEASDSPKEEAKKNVLKGGLSAIWITSGDLKDMGSLLAMAKEKGFDAVFVPVLNAGHTIYPGKRLPQDPKYKNSDPLRDAIKEAKGLGLKVHAVLQATLWGDEEHPVPPSSAKYPALYDRNLLGRTYAEQEKWQRLQEASLASYGPPSVPEPPGPGEKLVYLCPASQQLPRLLRSVAEEVAANYDIAGICLDGVDYPQSTPFVLSGENLSAPFGYTLEVRREMIRLNQLDPIDLDAAGLRTEADADAFALWDKFRRGRLMSLLAEVCAGFKSVRSDGVCSASLDLASDGPAPVRWSKLKGLDALLPLAAVTREEEGEEFVYPKETADAVTSLHRAVMKDAAVLTAIIGLDSKSLADQVSALNGMVKSAKDSGLRGYILRGDPDTLSTAMDALL